MDRDATKHSDNVLSTSQETLVSAESVPSGRKEPVWPPITIGDRLRAMLVIVE